MRGRRATRIRVDALGADFGRALLDDASERAAGLGEFADVHRDYSVVHPHAPVLVVKFEALLEGAECEHFVFERDRGGLLRF